MSCWMVKIYSYKTNEDEDGMLDTVEYIAGDSLKEVYRKALTACKSRSCTLGAIYKDCRSGEVYADDATKMETLSEYQILKGELGGVIVYRKNKSKNCYIRDDVKKEA